MSIGRRVDWNLLALKPWELAWGKANSHEIVDDIRLETSPGTKYFLLVLK